MPHRICKSIEVENGHMLSKHPDKCQFPHGHSRKVEIVIESAELDENQMVCDFKIIKVALEEWLDRFDHALCMNTDDPAYTDFKARYGDRVIGFEVGADDYVTKPFSVRELLLRIKVAFRRSSREEQDDRIMVMGPLVIDTGRCQVTVNGEEAIFTTTEYKLLCALVESRGRVLTRDHLLRHVWGLHTGTDSRTVDSHITRVRTKLGPCGEYIKTVRGFGYKMEEE